MKTSIILAAASAAALTLVAGQAARAQEGTPPPASMAPGAPTTAAPSTDVLNTRAARAEERINAGVETGALSRADAHRALEELANIRTEQNQLATRDGGLNDTDRQAINDRLSQLHRGITWLKNQADYSW